MTHVATLIVDPATPFLGERQVRTAASLLPAAGSPRWLGAGIAVDLPFAPSADGSNAQYAAAIRLALAPDPVDVVVQVAATRRKRLLVADLDSTLIRQESIDELADALGLRDHIAPITGRSMRGEIAFEAALCERVGLMRGLGLDLIRDVATRLTPMPGAGILARTLAALEVPTAIVSGGFTVVTEQLAPRLGFASHFANTLVIEDGRLTGALERPILDGEGKRQILLGLRYAHGLAPGDTMAVGDGANDVAMLREAGVGVAFRAKPVARVAAAAQIDHADLTALLYMQGFTLAEFHA